MNTELIYANPVIQMMVMMDNGYEFEVVDMPKKKEDGEYVYDG